VSSMSSSLDAEHLTANNKYTNFERPTLGHGKPMVFDGQRASKPVRRTAASIAVVWHCVGTHSSHESAVTEAVQFMGSIGA